MDVVISLLTFVVAVATCWIAILTYRSQKETGILQRQTRDSQRRAEKSLERATEIQDRMDVRDLVFRKSRANASLKHLVHVVSSAANRSSLIDDESGFGELMRLMSGWHEDLMNLPECELKTECIDVLPGLVAPGINSTVGGHHMAAIYHGIMNLRFKVNQGNLEDKCREAIGNMS